MSTMSTPPVYNGPLPGEDEVESEETLSLTDASVALTAVDKAAIDMQIATARAYPRSVSKAIKEATSLATLDEDTAGTMFYSLKRGNKTVEGPSVRLAEIMAYAWGNLRIDADIVAEDERTVTAMGTCFDLEKNVAVRIRVKRRITDKHGRRYNDDMIGVTSNAAIGIAVRNCVFKVIPRTFVSVIYDKARKASIGEGGTITQKRQKSFAWFAHLGVTPDQLFAYLGVKGEEDVGEEQLISLRGLATAIKDGDTTVEQAFRPHDRSEGAHELNTALGTAPAAPTAPTPVAEPKPAAKKAEKKEPPAATAAPASQPGTVCEACGGIDGKHKAACPYAEEA